MIIRDAVIKLKQAFGKRVIVANETFNGLPRRKQKIAVLAFGIVVTLISLFLLSNAKRGESTSTPFSTDRIAMPYDIFMENESEVSEDQLTPVGKMKGEIDGEFESFYVAVDNQGTIFINRDIEYSERAYDKTEDWKQISREKLMEYEKDLHFIPSKSKGVRR